MSAKGHDSPKDEYGDCQPPAADDNDTPVPALKVPEKRAATFDPIGALPATVGPKGNRPIELPEHQMRPFLKGAEALLATGRHTNLTISAHTKAHPTLTVFVVTDERLTNYLMLAQDQFNRDTAGPQTAPAPLDPRPAPPKPPNPYPLPGTPTLKSVPPNGGPT